LLARALGWFFAGLLWGFVARLPVRLLALARPLGCFFCWVSFAGFLLGFYFVEGCFGLVCWMVCIWDFQKVFGLALFMLCLVSCCIASDMVSSGACW
jgi:hypothetical protein